MTGKKSVCFIINPISGTGNQRIIPGLIHKYLDAAHYSYEIFFSEAAGHAVELGKRAVENRFDFVVAAGGDGTMNEVAQSLINSNAVLGIIPTGSGNGYARNFKIPVNPVKAIRLLNNPEIKRVDTATLNGRTFVNVAGTGFDAHIANLFLKNGLKGFYGYTTLVLKEFYKYKSLEYIIEVNNKTFIEKAFLISFSNGSQFGSGTKIAPKAKLDDGFIDLCVVKEFPMQDVPALIVRLFLNRIKGSRHYETLRTNNIKVKLKSNNDNEKILVHLDGEPLWIDTRQIQVKVNPLSLRVGIGNN